MKLNEYNCHDSRNYKCYLRELKTHPKSLEIVESFINSIKTEDIDSVIQELYSSNKLNTIYSAINNIHNLVYYGNRICDYIESYKGWYRLTKDIQLTYNFYGRSSDQITVTYSKGSYVNTLKRKEYSYQADYTETEYIPEDAVEKVDFDPTDSIYFDERGDEYYADPGKYIEGMGWEFANLEDKIKTGDRIYV